MVPKAACIIDGKICMSQSKIMKSVIALKKKMYFIMKTSLIKIKGCYEEVVDI